MTLPTQSSNLTIRNCIIKDLDSTASDFYMVGGEN